MTPPISYACPVCGIAPVNGYISHLHDCPFHPSVIAAEMEKEQRRIRRNAKLAYWKIRMGEVLLAVLVVIVGVSFLYLIGVIN